MNESSPADQADSALNVAHGDFRRGLPMGHFHVIVNPERAQKYVKHRLFVIGFALPLLGIGAALALSGYLWPGIVLVALGLFLPRVVKAQACKIVLYLAQHDAKVYDEVRDYEILEVRLR